MSHWTIAFLKRVSGSIHDGGSTHWTIHEFPFSRGSPVRFPKGAEGKKLFFNKNKHFLFQVRQSKTKYEIKGNTLQLLQKLPNLYFDPSTFLVQLCTFSTEPYFLMMNFKILHIKP
jgi:hypothetical protein